MLKSTKLGPSGLLMENLALNPTRPTFIDIHWALGCSRAYKLSRNTKGGWVYFPRTFRVYYNTREKCLDLYITVLSCIYIYIYIFFYEFAYQSCLSFLTPPLFSSSFSLPEYLNFSFHGTQTQYNFTYRVLEQLCMLIYAITMKN